jgi:hypothetical protein
MPAVFKKRRDKTSRTKRPPAVTVIAVAVAVLFFVRLSTAIRPLIEQDILRGGLTGPLYANGTLTAEGWAVITSAAYLLFTVALVLVLIGFLRLRRWGWVALMVFTAASLALAITQYFYGQPNYLVMASDVIIAFALSQSEVQKIYGMQGGSAQLLK